MLSYMISATQQNDTDGVCCIELYLNIFLTEIVSFLRFRFIYIYTINFGRSPAIYPFAGPVSDYLVVYKKGLNK